MPKGLLDKRVRKSLRLRAGGLLSALGFELTVDQGALLQHIEEQREKAREYNRARGKTPEYREWCRAYDRNYYRRVLCSEDAKMIQYREKKLAQMRASYAKDPTKKLAACAAYREAHRDEIRAKDRERYVLNKDKYNARRRAARAAKKAQEEAEKLENRQPKT